MAKMYQYFASAFLILNIIVKVLSQQESRHIVKLTNNKYTNIVVGIEAGVHEDLRILNKIETFFTNGSAALCTAMR